MADAAPASGGGNGPWAWAAALPEWVRAKGWTARSYRNGRLEATYFHVSLFDVPRQYWAEVAEAVTGSSRARGAQAQQEQEQGEEGEMAAALMTGLSLGGDGGGGEKQSVLEGEEEGEGESPTASSSFATAAAAAAAVSTTGATTMVCSRCRVSLAVSERVAHYQSPWHLLNLRRSLSKRPPLSLADYEASRRTEGDEGVEEGDSDKEEEEGEDGVEVVARESAAATVVVPPGGYALTVWSTLLSPDPKRSAPAELLDGLRALGRPHPHKWAVLMLRSGRFAGAVCEGSKAVAHKAFRRYTQRAKQGGSQASFDKKGKKAQSVGAQLRRQGEQKTREDVRSILGEWAELLKACDLIFLSVPKAMRGVLIGEADPPLLPKDDPRIRLVPFMVEQPSFAEVQSIADRLATVRFSSPSLASPSPMTPAAPPIPSSSSSSAPKEKEEGGVQEGTTAAAAAVGAPDPDWHAELAVAVKKGKIEVVAALLEGLDDEEQRARVLSARDLVENGEGASLLHLAAAKGNAEVIGALLSHGASPLLLDHRDRPPYYLATSRVARDAFRRARGQAPDQWDWDRAGVPEALTDELEEKRKEKAKEKKRRAKAKRQAEKARTAQQVEQAEAARAAAAAESSSSSSDSEEDRKGRGKPRCDSCGKVVKVLYTRLEFIYCSTDCVQTHKRALLAEAAMRRLGGGGGGK